MKTEFIIKRIESQKPPVFGSLCIDDNGAYIWSSAESFCGIHDDVVVHDVYILSTSDITVDDWCLKIVDGVVSSPKKFDQASIDNLKGLHRIIATTNQDLGLPNLHTSLMIEYADKINTGDEPMVVSVEMNDVVIAESIHNYDDNTLFVNGDEVMSMSYEFPDVLEKESLKYIGKPKLDVRGCVYGSFVTDSNLYDNLRRMAIFFKALGGNEKDNCWLSHHNEMFAEYVKKHNII